MGGYERLQEGLGGRLEVQGSTTEHVVVVLPSHTMPPRLLLHNASLLPALEHRALVDGLQVAHSTGVEVIVVTSTAPPEAVLAYYASLARPNSPEQARRRISCLVVPDDGARGISAKLLDRPDLLTVLRERIAGRPAVIEPWNVTADEVAVALALDTPINGGPSELWPLGFKSASRRLFREAEVPVPVGVEDVHDSAEVAAAIRAMRHDRPLLDRVVVKLDNSGAGEGNWATTTRDATGRELTTVELTAHIETHAPAWFLTDLAAGGVVEELVTGPDLASPSGQAEIRPGGQVVVLATHEQVLGGASGHVFTGSRFPADPAYAAALAEHTAAVAHRLADRGALGWVTVDFVALREAHGWTLVAVDLNLRKGGTTHSYAALRYLVPGSYDATGQRWVADTDGSPRYYRSSDAAGGPAWIGLDPADAVRAVTSSGLSFEGTRGSGVVLHMFPALRGNGTIGVTAIGRSAAEADELFDAVPAVLDARVRTAG
jgi:hypothetical protein